MTRMAESSLSGPLVAYQNILEYLNIASKNIQGTQDLGGRLWPLLAIYGNCVAGAVAAVAAVALQWPHDSAVAWQLLL